MTTEEDKAAAAKIREAEAAKKAPPATDPAKLDTKQAEKDAQMEYDRGDHNVTVNNPAAPEAVAAQHAQVDKDLAARNEANKEGHEKNMERIEQDAQEAQARTAHADDHRARHVPTGKEQNHNTPRVLTDGTKVWDT